MLNEIINVKTEHSAWPKVSLQFIIVFIVIFIIMNESVFILSDEEAEVHRNKITSPSYFSLFFSVHDKFIESKQIIQLKYKLQSEH